MGKTKRKEMGFGTGKQKKGFYNHLKENKKSKYKSFKDYFNNNKEEENEN